MYQFYVQYHQLEISLIVQTVWILYRRALYGFVQWFVIRYSTYSSDSFYSTVQCITLIMIDDSSFHLQYEWVPLTATHGFWFPKEGWVQIAWQNMTETQHITKVIKTGCFVDWSWDLSFFCSTTASFAFQGWLCWSGSFLTFDFENVLSFDTLFMVEQSSHCCPHESTFHWVVDSDIGDPASIVVTSRFAVLLGKPAQARQECFLLAATLPNWHLIF